MHIFLILLQKLRSKQTQVWSAKSRAVVSWCSISCPE